MKQVVDRLVFGAQIAVVVLSLLALVVSGAGAAARLFDPSEPTKPTRPARPTESLQRPQNATLDNKPSPDEAPGEMATNGRPWTEQAAYLHATPAVVGGASQSRLGHDSDQITASICCLSARNGSDLVSASPTLVDHRLGHRFTLLGLKPSGTS